MTTKVVITWVPEDVSTLRPEWTEDQCEQFLLDNAKVLRDRSIEVGWGILEDCLP